MAKKSPQIKVPKAPNYNSTGAQKKAKGPGPMQPSAYSALGKK